MAKFHSLLLSPNMEKTVEGYLICKNVSICRSGYQEYFGHELIDFPGFEESWGLEPDTKYKVYRPPEEVLSTDTKASFEGKTVVNEHPDGSIVHVDNEAELHCGHVQDVKEGPKLGDQVTLQCDMVIKDPDLISRVLDDNEREISCGYTLRLKRLNGTLIMYCIRGNHVAVVSKGRAGSRIAIKDSAPPEIKRKKDSTMSIRDKIFGRGLKEVVAEASPEELAELGVSITGARAANDSGKETKPEPKEEKPANDKEPHRTAAHAALDRCMDAMKSADGMGCDAHGKPRNLKHLKAELDSFLKEEEKPAEDGEVENLEDAKPSEEGKEDGELAEDAGAHAEKEIDDAGKSVLKAANDSIREYIKSSKPLVAAIAAKPKKARTQQEQVMVDSYNTAVRTLNASKTNPYAALSLTKIPDGLATDAVPTDTAVVQENVSQFYEGVPYRVGKQRHEEHLRQKGSK